MTLQLGDRVLQHLGCTVHMQSAAPCSQYLQTLTDFALERGPKAFDALEPTFPRRFLEILERTNAELIVEAQHLVGSKAGYSQKIEQACWQLGPHLREGGIGAGTVEVGNSLRDGFAHTGYLA
jgi:hypothetical protein